MVEEKQDRVLVGPKRPMAPLEKRHWMARVLDQMMVNLILEMVHLRVS